jgi:hypothetical protein
MEKALKIMREVKEAYQQGQKRVYNLLKRLGMIWEGSETSCLGTPGETTRPSHTFKTRHCGDFNLRSGEAGCTGKPMGRMGT